MPPRPKTGWRGPEYPGEFPTLGYHVAELIQSVCVIPDGERAGDPYVLTDEQLRFLLWHYRLDPVTGRFVYFRGSQLVRPQKWGKGPFASAVICAEAHPEGPVLFDGWDAAGEPVGRPWATPHIQITAVSEDQVENVYRALVPMIELGALHADIPDTGKTRINLPSGGIIEPVTASAVSRLGQRVTFVVQDQTESWTKQNKGRALADNQRRGLAGMGGRFMSTPNAWDPAEESVAQYTSEKEHEGVYHDDVDAGPGSVRNKADRRRMLKTVYGDSAADKVSEHTGARGWVDLHRIDGEIVALLDRDPAQAERWFLNRKRAAEDAVFAEDTIKALERQVDVPDGSLIVVGVDGARFADALAMVATHVESGHQWPLGIWERPASAPDGYEHPFHEVDGALSEAFERFQVWRVYIDPQWIDHLVDTWQGRWSKDRVLAWYTNRPKQISWAVRNYVHGAAAGDWSHNGDPVFVQHLLNAKKQLVNVYDDQHRQMFTLSKDRSDSPRKMDGAMAGVLSWEARGDAIAADAQVTKPASRVAVFH